MQIMHTVAVHYNSVEIVSSKEIVLHTAVKSWLMVRPIDLSHSAQCISHPAKLWKVQLGYTAVQYII